MYHQWIVGGGHPHHDLHPVISRTLPSSADRWRKATRTISAAHRFQSYGSASSGGFASGVTSAGGTPAATTPGAAEVSDEDEYYHTADEDEELGHGRKPIARSDDPRSGAFGDAVHKRQGEVAEDRERELQQADSEFRELSDKTAALQV